MPVVGLLLAPGGCTGAARTQRQRIDDCCISSRSRSLVRSFSFLITRARSCSDGVRYARRLNKWSSPFKDWWALRRYSISLDVLAVISDSPFATLQNGRLGQRETRHQYATVSLLNRSLRTCLLHELTPHRLVPPLSRNLHRSALGGTVNLDRAGRPFSAA